MMYYFNDFYPFQMFGLGPLFMILFWALIIYGVVMLLRRGHSWNDNSNSNDRSIKTLKERYAKGEITKEQFESMKKDLG